MKTPALLLTAAALATAFLLWPASPPATSRLQHQAAAEKPLVMHDVAPAAASGQKFDHSRLLRQLASAQDPAVLALIQRALAASTPQQKGQAADALAVIGSHEAVEHLIQLAAAQEHPAHRASILEGLNNLTNPDGLAALASTLTATRDAEVIAAATSTLSRAGNADTLNALVDFYRERNEGPQQKNAVLHAIAALKNAGVQWPLAKLAQNAPEPALAAAARQALANRE